MLLNVRKFLLGFVLSLFLLPMVAFASTEFKGTETVNINKANAATLAAYLKGIGPNKAKAIEKYRKSNGKFKTAADIKNVPGIGDETYKKMKSKISTSRGVSVAPKDYKLGESSGKSTSSKKKTRAKKASDSSSSSSSTSKKPKSSKSKNRKSKSSGSTSSSSNSTSKKPLSAKDKAAAKKKAAAAKKKAAAKAKKAAAAKKKAAAKAKKAKNKK